MSFPEVIVQGGKGGSQGHHNQCITKKKKFFLKVWSYFFDRQLFESRQRAGEEADYKRCRGADNIQHGGWEHRDVRMLPGEGVEQSHYCMTTLRQCAAEREKEGG